MIAAASLVDRVLEQFGENSHAVPYAAGRAREIDDQRAAGQAGHAARQRRGRHPGGDAERANGLGYAGDLANSAEVTRGGYYRTGDIARRDANGYLTYVGRVDDVFKASDYRLSPFELESALIEFPAIAEAAVVPAPDPLRASVPKAFIVLASGYEPSRKLARDIFAFILERLAPYKRIRLIEFAELPKTISGKIRRAELCRRQQESIARGTLEFSLDDFPELRQAAKG